MQWSMGASCGKRSARRLLLLIAVAAFGSLILAAPAFAQGGLASLANTVLPETGSSLDNAVDDDLAAAAPILDTATPVADAAAPVLDAAAPVVEAADPVVQKTTAPVLQTAAPVLDGVAPVLETTTSVVQAATTVTAPVTQPVSDLTASTLETVDEVAQAPDVASTGPDSTAVEAARTANGDVGAAVDTDRAGSSRGYGASAAAPRGRDHGRNVGNSATYSQSSQLTIPAVDPWSPAPAASASRPAASAKAPGAPSPHGPSVPAPPSSISAGSFGGGALFGLAALGALLLLAAPGMSRRLRLMLALPPLPVALSPLERPG
jgi:hypothetical protein